MGKAKASRRTESAAPHSAEQCAEDAWFEGRLTGAIPCYASPIPPPLSACAAPPEPRCSPICGRVVLPAPAGSGGGMAMVLDAKEVLTAGAAAVHQSLTPQAAPSCLMRRTRSGPWQPLERMETAAFPPRSRWDEALEAVLLADLEFVWAAHRRQSVSSRERAAGPGR